MRRLRCVWLLLGGLLAGTVQAAPLVRVGFYENIPPWVSSGSQPGIAVELLREALQAEGYTLKAEFYPYARRLAMYRRGELDALYDVSNALQKQEQLPGQQGKPLHSFDNLAIALGSRRLNIEHARELSTHRVMAWEGAFVELPASYDRMLSSLEGRYREVADPRLQARSLFLGRSDVILCDRLIFEWNRRLLLGNPQLRAQQAVNYYPVLPPKEAGVLWRDPLLRQRVDARLRDMKADGRYDAVFRRYHSEPQP